jgi:hypothetical protein
MVRHVEIELAYGEVLRIGAMKLMVKRRKGHQEQVQFLMEAPLSMVIGRDPK